MKYIRQDTCYNTLDKICRDIKEWVSIFEKSWNVYFKLYAQKICTIRVKGKFHNGTFMSEYIITEDVDKPQIGDFYDQFQNVCEKIQNMPQLKGWL